MPSVPCGGRHARPEHGRAALHAQAPALVCADRHPGHGRQDTAHLRGCRPRPARRHGVPAHQPPAGLPGLRQGRRVPPAEPGTDGGPRQVPLHGRQAHVQEAAAPDLPDPAGSRALHPVPALRAFRQGDLGRRVHGPAGSWRRHRPHGAPLLHGRAGRRLRHDHARLLRPEGQGGLDLVPVVPVRHGRDRRFHQRG